MSDSSLTVEDCRQALQGIVAPTEFVSMLNQASERLLNSGKFKGSLVNATFATPNGFITLPPNYMSVLSGKYTCVSMPIFSQWHAYMENGIGEATDVERWGGALRDIGGAFCTQADITSDTGKIRVFSAVGDDGLLVRIYGLDSNGEVIFDNNGEEGEAVTLANPNVDTLTTFSRITGFQKPKSKFPVRLSVVGSQSTYQIASYLPSETRPRYRRYACGDAGKAIQVLCQRKFFPVSANGDWVHPGNLAALKNELLALQFESENSPELYTLYHDRAVNFLNDEQRAFRGGMIMPPPSHSAGFGYEITSLH